MAGKRGVPTGKFAFEFGSNKAGWIQSLEGGHAVADVVAEKVGPDHIVHKMFMGGEWVNLDTWAEPGLHFSDGKFGFLVQGDDEIGLTNFTFQPK